MPESLTEEFKTTKPSAALELWTYEVVRSIAALYNSGGGILRMGVENNGAVSGGHALADYDPDGSLLAKTLGSFLDSVPPFSAVVENGHVKIEVSRGVTSHSFLKKTLVHPHSKVEHPPGSIFVRKFIGGVPSSAPPTTRSDWQAALHLWEGNRGVTLQGQIIIQFTLLVNNWNPFEPGGTTGYTIHQAHCIADVAGTLGRTKLREGLCEIIGQMKPILERADQGPVQNARGGEYKQPIVAMITKLCRELGLSAPQ